MKKQTENRAISEDTLEIIHHEEYSFVKSYNACNGSKGKEYKECIISNPDAIENILSTKILLWAVKNQFILNSELNLKKKFECNNNDTFELKCSDCDEHYTFSIIEKTGDNKVTYELLIKNQNGKIVTKKEIDAEDEGNCFVFIDLNEDENPEIISLSRAYWVNSEHYSIDIFFNRIKTQKPKIPILIFAKLFLFQCKDQKAKNL